MPQPQLETNIKTWDQDSVDDSFGKMQAGDDIILDSKQVTKQMLLTCKILRRRNNNVIPITMTRVLPHVASQTTRKICSISPLKTRLESQNTSRITGND